MPDHETRTTTIRHRRRSWWFTTTATALLSGSVYTTAFHPTQIVHTSAPKPSSSRSLRSSYLDTLDPPTVVPVVMGSSYLDALSTTTATTTATTVTAPVSASVVASPSSYLDALSTTSAAVIVAPPPTVETTTTSSYLDALPPTDTAADENENEKENPLPPPRDAADETIVTPLFDFTGGSTQKGRALASFDRIDDAIMGGISRSGINDGGVDKDYAVWSGICREEGGGFCGIRTLPFKNQQPLPTADEDGIYVDCRLSSDDEPQRRVWKMTLRTKPDRTTEQVYQAEFDLRPKLGKGTKEEGGSYLDSLDPIVPTGGDGVSKEEWVRVRVPFSSFRLVRGPRLVEGSPPPDVSGGIYQIGLSLSKFQMAGTLTEKPDFRPGFFEMRIRSVGFFRGSGGGTASLGADEAAAGVVAEEEEGGEEVRGRTGEAGVETVSKKEADAARPTLFKVLAPLFRFFFSESRNRRKTALKLMIEKRGMSKWEAVWAGMKRRPVWKTAGMVGAGAVRSAAGIVLKVLFVPVRFFLKVKKSRKESGEGKSTATTD